MRYTDLIKSQILDLLTALDAEGISTVPLATLQRELNGRGLDVDEAGFMDLLDSIDIVDNVSDEGIVYFNSDPGHKDIEADRAEKQDNDIDRLARKQVKKELDK
jgi:hypothetical protein